MTDFVIDDPEGFFSTKPENVVVPGRDASVIVLYPLSTTSGLTLLVGLPPLNGGTILGFLAGWAAMGWMG